MKTLIQSPQFQKKEKKIEEKKEKIEEKKEVEEYKTITFEPKEKEHKRESLSEETIFIGKETSPQNLPEGTIVITTKTEEEKPKKEDEEFLDLSKL